MMKNRFFYLLTIILLANFSLFGQSIPTQHFMFIPQVTAVDTAVLCDSIYANGNYDSLISIDYKIYRNGVLIDTMSKYGWAELRLRQMGQAYVQESFDSGVFVFPRAIPFAGMTAQSFTISIINAEPRCNRNRVPILTMQFREPGTYKVVSEIYTQKNYKTENIGTFACNKYSDRYSLYGAKKALWTKDSVSFVVSLTHVVTDTVSVCKGDTYFWRGRNYAVSGLYQEIRHNMDGSDSVYRLKFTILPRDTMKSVIKACQGKDQYWRGRFRKTDGIYHDSVINKYGCMDYYILDLIYLPKFLHSDTVWVCKGESFSWRGKTIITTGLHTQVYDNAVHHCDSVYELWVKNYPDYTRDTMVVICKGNSYSWRGRTLVKAGVYIDSLKTIQGCDSLFRLTLKIDNGFFHKETVDVCSVDGTYAWHGRRLSVSGMYYDSLKTIHGCDSVYHLDFRIRPAYLFTTYDTVANNVDYTWTSRNRNLGKLAVGPQVFWDSLKTAKGCDSVYKHCVWVNQAYENHTIDSICESGIYQWVGHSRIVIGQKAAGVYVISDSLKTKDGADSVHALTLHVLPTYLKEESVSICENEIYQWQGHAVSIGRKAAGTYVIWDSLHTRFGCDSVHKLTLTVHPTYYKQENASICENETYIWQGHAVNIGRKVAGTYIIYDSLQTQHACDSVYELTLTVNPTYYQEENASVCANKVYQWAGHSVSIGLKSVGSHVIWDSLKTAKGCDSVFKLNLTVYPVYAFNESAEACANAAYTWKGHQVSIGVKPAGNYVIWDSLKTVHGCDSVYRLNLKVNHSYYVEYKATICESDMYVWYGHEVGIGKRAPGTYVFWDSLRSVNGCDSVFKLTLKVNPAYNFTEKAEICDNEIYVWKGHDVNIGKRAPGSHVIWDRKKTVKACDSIYKLTLTVHPSYFFESTDSTCDAASYVWKGHQADVRLLPAGTHVLWDSLKTVHGCDSVFKHTLTVFRQYLAEENDEICSGDILNWRGRQLTVGGTYDDTLKTVNACDSIFRMRLTVHPSHIMQEIVPICNNSSYAWRGRQLTQPGIYTDSLKTRFGCDSVYSIELRVNPVYLFEDTLEGCEGVSYTWRGRQLTKAGTYTDSLKASFGCDSIFVLSFYRHPVYDHTDTVEICADASYAWHGRNYRVSGLYTDSLQSVWGCDSICRLRLIVHPVYVMRDTQEICQNERLAWRGKRYTQAGLYSDSLKTIHGCDSVYTLYLYVRPVFVYTDTVSICSHETYQWRGRMLHSAGLYEEQLISRYGCDSIYNLQLLVNPSYYYQDTQEICGDAVYYWRGRRLSKAGLYTDSLTSADGCPMVYTMLLKVNANYHQADTAVICDNETYAWQGRVLQREGDYEVKLKTVHGCDSVYTLNLQVNPTYYQMQRAAICAGQEYVWHGRRLSMEGMYYDSLKSVNSCDSVWALQLTVNPVYVQYDTARTCQHSSYTWHGRKLFLSGDYSDSLLTGKGCDSVFHLNLIVDSMYYSADRQYICEGSVLSWRGRYLTAAGMYYDSLRTAHGCDSVYSVEVIAHPQYYREDTVSICEGASYDWRGQTLKAGGRYYERMWSIHGCDSTCALYLMVQKVYETNEYAMICGGESYAWHGKQLREQKRYIDTLQTRFGCDSVTRIFLYVYPHYHFNDTVNYCGKGIYSWRNRNFDKDGCYTDSFKTVNGCDSIYTLHLRFRKPFYQEEQQEICAGSVYAWRGRQLTQSGVYTDSLRSVYGCDSVYRLSLKVNEKYLFSDTQAICQGAVYSWRGRQLVQSGLYTDSLHTVNGCDSVYRLHLNVHPVYVFNEMHSVCQGASYAWHGRQLTQTGMYADSLLSIHGCDSVHVLMLRVNPVYQIEENQSICQGASYAWHGRQLTQSGVYTDSLRSAYGCDSVYRLSLKVNEKYLFSDTQAICQGAVCSWRGRQLVQSGLYTDSLHTVNGCDSVYRLQLDVHPVYVFSDTQSICNGEMYTWRGREFTQTGVYADSLHTVNACDSVYLLYLNVHPVYVFNDTQSVCDGEMYVWRGRELTESGLYIDSLHTANGCDSVYLLQFTVHPVYAFSDTAVICKGDTLHWQGMALTQTGVYTDSLKTLTGCDSIRMMSLTVRELPEKLGLIHGDTLIEHDGVYMYYTDTLSGIDTYEWTIFPEDINLTTSASKAWLTLDKKAYGMDTLKVVGHHVCGVTEASVLPIHVTIGVSVLEAESPELCRAFPNPVRDELSVEVPAFETWSQPTWMLCDAQGRCLGTGRLEEVRTCIRMEEYARGVYVLRLFSEHKVKATLKIVKY